MEFTLHPTVQRFEFGTENDALFYGLGQAIDFVTTIGLDRIWKHNHALAERFYAGLKDIPGAEMWFQVTGEWRAEGSSLDSLKKLAGLAEDRRGYLKGR